MSDALQQMQNRKATFMKSMKLQLINYYKTLLESPDENEREEQIEFPSVDQIINMIQNKNKENISKNQTWKLSNN